MFSQAKECRSRGELEALRDQHVTLYNMNSVRFRELTKCLQPCVHQVKPRCTKQTVEQQQQQQQQHTSSSNNNNNKSKAETAGEGTKKFFVKLRYVLQKYSYITRQMKQESFLQPFGVPNITGFAFSLYSTDKKTVSVISSLLNNKK